jgi:capsular exopolysaccharide synthesis family protein
METKRELDRTPKVRAIVNDQSNEAILVDNKNILNNLEIRRAELLEIYLPTSKNVKEVDAQIETKKRYIAELERNLKRTIEQTNPEYDVNSRRYSDALANRDAAASRRASLEQLLNDRTGRVNNLGTLTKDQREFERRIALHAQSIQQMQDLQDRVQLRNNQIRTSVQKLTQAVFAERTMPNWPVNMAIATIVGLALAVVFSLIRDSAQDKVHTKEDAYLLTGITPLASIPERSRTKHPIITNPQSNAAFESYRVLRSNIAAQAKERSIKSITVTSTLRREGKSVVASNLAIAYVLIGQRTILVDANMRHPSLHTLFGLPDKPGLGDLLLGTATVNDVLQSTTVEGLYVVTVGTIPANATEVMGSPRMQEILNLLTDQADMVIVDAPQIVGLADAPSLAAVTDGSVIVTITGKPSKAEFKEAVGIIDAASPALLGSVYNRVSAKEAHLTKG